MHVTPDRTDIGKRLLLDEELFEQPVLASALNEYSHSLHELMDLALVVLINVTKDLVATHDESKVNLSKRLGVFEKLNLRYSHERVAILIG